MSLGFGGEVAKYYAEFRRGYPAEIIEALCEGFELTPDDTALDLGCGTGQLAVPLAARVRHVIGMDPEPDMLRLAGETAARHGVRNATWVLGADTDVPSLGALLGGRPDGPDRSDRTGRSDRPGPLAAAVIGQALHWMRHDVLFAELLPLLRTGGGLAVLANGAPAWLQDSEWSRALRGFLEEHFGTRLRASCGTGRKDRERYAQSLDAAGFTGVRHTEFRYESELTFGELLGGIYSALPERQLPARADRPAFAERLRRALPPAETYTEHVCVSVLTGRAAAGAPGAAAGTRT